MSKVADQQFVVKSLFRETREEICSECFDTSEEAALFIEGMVAAQEGDDTIVFVLESPEEGDGASAEFPEQKSGEAPAVSKPVEFPVLSPEELAAKLAEGAAKQADLIRRGILRPQPWRPRFDRFAEEQKPPQDYFVEEIDGVKFPYPVMALYGEPDAHGMVETVYHTPDYIRAYQRGNWAEGDRLALAEALREARRQMGFESLTWYGNLNVSNAVPEGEMWLNPDGIVMNEREADERAADADGDKIQAHLPLDADMSILEEDDGIASKFPITKQPPRLRVKFGRPRENFHEKSALVALRRTLMREENKAEYDLDSLFVETHKKVQVGLITNKWGVKEAERVADALAAGQSLDEALELLKADPQLFLDIEKPMKDRSKGMGHLASNLEILEYNREYVPEHAWAYNGRGSIAKRKLSELEFLMSCDPKVLFDDVANMRLRFQPGPQGGAKPKYQYSEEYYPEDEGVIDRCFQMGRIFVEEIERGEAWEREGLPNAVAIWLTLPNGEAVAFTDYRRTGTHRGGQVGYLWIAYPEVRPQRDGSVHVISPLDSLSEWVANHFDSAIVNPETGQVSSYFPQLPKTKSKNWEDPFLRYGNKARALQACIAQWLEKHGDLVPAEWSDEDQTFYASSACDTIASMTVLVDYGSYSNTVPEMLWLQKRAQLAVGRLAHAGGKGDDQRYRKYVFSRENGTPLYADPRSNPKRSANQRSQLLRSAKKVTMRVAVVAMDTETGVLITPSGIRKQELGNGAFLPKLVPEEEEGFIPRSFPTWALSHRILWVGDAKKTAQIGKLLDTEGMKFVPMRYSQAAMLRDENATGSGEIDLIIPIQEIAKKGCLRVYMEKAELATIVVDGKEVPAYVLEWNFLRSGAASENDPARVRKALFTGLDGQAIGHACKKAGIENLRAPDYTFATALINAVKKRRMAAYENALAGDAG